MSAQLTVDMIIKYAKSLDNKMPEFPNKQEKILALSPDKMGLLGVFDVESTGLDHNDNEVIELALNVYLYNKETFEILGINSTYNEYNEPSDLSKISPKITELTGITQDMVVGKKINWKEVSELFNSCDYLVAHNASFDSAILSKYIEVKKPIMCSMRLVDWNRFEVPNKKQEILVLAICEFTYEGHRASIDVEALALLIEKTNTLGEMIQNTLKKTLLIEGYVDKYQESTIKEALKAGIKGHKFEFKKAIHPVSKKETWFYECKNLTEKDLFNIQDIFWEMVDTYNPSGESKIFIDIIDQ